MDELTPQQFAVLYEHRKLNPRGEHRQDLRHAHLLEFITNLLKSPDAEPITAEHTLAHFHQSIGTKKRRKVMGPGDTARMTGAAR